ncbi:MAG: DUF4270 family protein [Bacteroidales bacterium]|nr:DUF4270 family protein [Bacteroidales bacterium]
MTSYYLSSILPCRFISVSHQLFKIIRLTLFALAAFLMISCEEGPTKIGEGLLPGSDFVTIKSIDTLSVWSYTMYDDSVRTDNPSVSYLGQIYDPYFGTTTAEFVTQIRMAGKWDDLPFAIDSVKLFLNLLDVKGGSGVTHTLRLSEISQQIYTDSAYYSNKQVPLTGYDVADIQLPVLKSDTVNNIVIKLPVGFGNYLTRDTSMLFHSNTKPDFRSFFKGLYFRMYSSSDPMLVALSLAPPSTLGAYNNYLVLFMHNEVDVQKEFYFILDAINRNASFNRFSHNFNTASAGKKIEHINDGYRDTLSYLQYLNGVYTKITLSGLESLKNDPAFDNIAVNKARLTVPVYFDGNLYKASTVPSNLRLRYKTKSGYKYDVPDYNIDQYHSFFDGTIDTTANLYKFNIAAFVQGYLEDATGVIKPELELFQGAGTRNVILKANNSKTPVKFELTYTKF